MAAAGRPSADGRAGRGGRSWGASAADGREGHAEVLGGNGYIDDYPGVSGGGR